MDTLAETIQKEKRKKRRARERFRSIAGGGGKLLPGSVLSDWFEAEGATQPWYAGSTQYNAVRYNNKTYVTFETFERVPDKRFCKIVAYNHDTGVLGRVYTVGPQGNVEDDDHGVPAIEFNADGRASVVWGNHDGNFHIATMTNPEDESLWTVISNGVVGAYTYPHLQLIGTTVYCTIRKDLPPGAPFANGGKILVYRPITYAGATATVGAEVEIANFGDNSRFYQGNHFVISDRMAQVAARADYGDTFRRDVYYYEIDFTNGRLQSINGTTVNFPVDRTNMDATFRIHQTAGVLVLQTATMAVNSVGRIYIAFAEGSNGGSAQSVYQMIGAAGTFQAPTDLGFDLDSDLDAPRLVNELGDKVGIYYPKDPDNIYTRNGDIFRRMLPFNGGNGDYGLEELIMRADDARWGLGQVSVVKNAHANMRLLFTEAANSSLDADAIPYKRGFALGDRGFIRKLRPSLLQPASFVAEGHFYDINDLSTLFSDTAGTTLAVVDGPVRRINDKSGNNHHAILEGSEPGTLRFDASSGLYWLDIGDEISPTCSYAAPAYLVVANDAYWACCAARNWESGANATTVVEIDEGVGLDRIYRLVHASALHAQLIPFSNAGTGINVNSTANSVRYDDDFVFGLHVNGVNATGYLNGIQYATGTVGSVPDTGASIPRIGANATLTATSYLQGRFSAWIHRAGNIDLATRVNDMSVMLSRQGY